MYSEDAEMLAKMFGGSTLQYSFPVDGDSSSSGLSRSSSGLSLSSDLSTKIYWQDVTREEKCLLQAVKMKFVKFLV